jgi:hypothetical protein
MSDLGQGGDGQRQRQHVADRGEVGDDAVTGDDRCAELGDEQGHQRE